MSERPRSEHKDNRSALEAYGHVGARDKSWFGYRWIGADLRSFRVDLRSAFFGIR